ncbi:MAG: NAD(P)-dependent glycerol-3-phosphate dehydrogenase [Acidobacteria bacterium]|nr:NAD(P)-dependent glycerol-3-phosphate dehydrogenase [Acidobacteriota bacterium]
MPIGILGAGSFGTALAIHAVRAGHAARLWVRRPEAAERMRAERENATYLPGVELPESLEVVETLDRLADTEPLVVAVPSHGYRDVLASCLAARASSTPLTVVSATKGIEAESLARMSRVSAEEAERVGVACRFAVLSGPTFAAELARGAPSAAVIASADEEAATALRETLASPTLRLYSSADVTGVELAGTAKNVIAIAAGVVAGLGLGHNTLAALITRGLHEMTRLVLAYGGEAETLRGLAGLGDLVLTCTGGLSRNRRTGHELAQGKTLETILGETTEVAEGVKNSRVIARLAADAGVEMPISEQMVSVLYEGKGARQAVHELMTRDLKREAEL